MTNRLSIVFVSLVSLQISVRAANPNGYEIQFNLPDKIGDKHRIHSTGSEPRTMTLRRNGRTVKRDRKVNKWEIEFDLEVSSVSARNFANGGDILIRKLTSTDSSASLPAGTRLRVQIVDGDERFSIEGKPVSKELDAFLDRVVNLDTGNSSNDDQYGTTERKNVGDHWDVNKASMVADAERHGHTFLADKISGHVKFERLTQVKDTECLQIRVMTKVDDFSDKAVEGFEVQNSSISMDIKALLPADQSMPALEESQRVAMRAKMESVSQSGMVLDMSSVISLKTEYIYQRQ